MKRLLLSLAIFLLVSCSAAAQDLDEAIEARNSGNFRKAIKILKPLASKGNSEAQYYFGEMLSKGEGLPQNYKYAFSYYLKAAKKKNNLAEYKLGLMYKKGWGVSLDHKKAFHWWRKAAANGNEDAQMNLSHVFFKGKGVKQNFLEAYAWSVIAASQKYKGAEGNKKLVEKLLTRSELSKAKKLAKIYWEKYVEPHQTGSHFRRAKLKF